MVFEPIGQILIRKGFCTPTDLHSALERQRRSGGKIGDILLKAEVISEEHIVQALFEQFQLNTYLEQELKKKENELRKFIALEKELSLARDIQQNFLPKELTEVPHLDVAGTCIMCGNVGGDYFDVLESEFGCYNFVLSDVAGHGIASSLIMASLRSMLRIELVCDCLYLEKIAEKINRMVSSDFHLSGLFITSILARYEPNTFKLSFVNAGHPRPLTTCQDNISVLSGADLPWGIVEDVQYTLYQTRLHPDERILLYSDGIIEAEDKHGHPYGVERLWDCLHSSRVQSSQELIAFIVEDFQKRTQRQEDDITLLALWRH